MISCILPHPLRIKCWHFVIDLSTFEIHSQCPSISCSSLPKWLLGRFKSAYVCVHGVNLMWIGELRVKTCIYVSVVERIQYNDCALVFESDFRNVLLFYVKWIWCDECHLEFFKCWASLVVLVLDQEHLHNDIYSK